MPINPPTPTAVERPLPDSLTRALNAYRDRCWRGGDPTPERMCVEREIENHVAEMVSAALDRVMPPTPDDNALREFLEDLAQDAERQADLYAHSRAVQEDWANHARMFRVVLERLYGKVAV